MDFRFTERQEDLRRRVREFTVRELKPYVAKLDRDSQFPWNLWAKMRDEGLTAASIPESYGGRGYDAVSTGVMVEEISRHSSYFFGSLAVLHTIGGGPLIRHATQGAKEEWLKPFLECRKLIAPFRTEPHGGSDVASIRTVAVKKGEEYVISGEKTQVSYAVTADAGIVYAKTAPEKGVKGISAFLVPLNLPGITRYGFEDMGYRGMDRGSVVFQDVKVPSHYLIGEENRGIEYTMESYDIDRILLAFIPVGVAMASLEEVIDFVGRNVSDIADTDSGIRSSLATDLARMEAARWLCYRMAWTYDKGSKVTKGVAMARWYASVNALEAIDHAIQSCGYLGASRSYLHEQRWRDVRASRLSHGTEEMLKMVIAREILGAEFTPYA